MSPPSISLSNGVSMPIIGLGTWQAAPGEVERALRVALDCGYRHIDTATRYNNEAEIGGVLREYFDAGKLKREEVFVTTKLFPCGVNKEGAVENALRESLQKLQLEYVDLYLVHIPVAFKEDGSSVDPEVKVEQIWQQMEGVYEKKLARSIGVSNFSISQIERIMSIASTPIHNQQVELHLHFPQFDMHACCKRNHISLTAYAPIGSPGRVNVKAVAGRSLDWKEHAPAPLENPLVLELAKKYDKTPAQILLRHLIQRQIIVIPKSTNEKRIKENFDIFNFSLSEEEVHQLDTVGGPQIRTFCMEFSKGHPEFPF